MWASVTSIPEKEQANVVLVEAIDENVKAEKRRIENPQSKCRHWSEAIA